MKPSSPMGTTSLIKPLRSWQVYLRTRYGKYTLELGISGICTASAQRDGFFNLRIFPVHLPCCWLVEGPHLSPPAPETTAVAFTSRPSGVGGEWGKLLRWKKILCYVLLVQIPEISTQNPPNIFPSSDLFSTSCGLTYQRSLQNLLPPEWRPHCTPLKKIWL